MLLSVLCSTNELFMNMEVISMLLLLPILITRKEVMSSAITMSQRLPQHGWWLAYIPSRHKCNFQPEEILWFVWNGCLKSVGLDWTTGLVTLECGNKEGSGVVSFYQEYQYVSQWVDLCHVELHIGVVVIRKEVVWSAITRNSSSYVSLARFQ